MYRAYLRQEDESWEQADSDIAVLNHDDEVIIYDTYEEWTDKPIRDKLTDMYPGKHVAESGGWNSRKFIVSDIPIFDSTYNMDWVKALKTTGAVHLKGLHQWPNYSYKGRKYYIAGVYVRQGRDYDNIIAEWDEESELFRMTYDEELYQRAEMAMQERRNRAEARRRRKFITPRQLDDAACSLMYDCKPFIFYGTSRMAHRMAAAITLHDHFNGRRATNTKLRPLANRWFDQIAAHGRKPFEALYLGTEELEFLEKRLALLVPKSKLPKESN